MMRVPAYKPRFGADATLVTESDRQLHSYTCLPDAYEQHLEVSNTVECHLSGRHLSEHVRYPTVESAK